MHGGRLAVMVPHKSHLGCHFHGGIGINLLWERGMYSFPRTEYRGDTLLTQYFHQYADNDLTRTILLLYGRCIITTPTVLVQASELPPFSLKYVWLIYTLNNGGIWRR